MKQENFPALASFEVNLTAFGVGLCVPLGPYAQTHTRTKASLLCSRLIDS